MKSIPADLVNNAKDMSMRCFIFGCGYLGKRVAKAWLDAGNEVFAMTRSSVNASTFRESGIQPFIGDVCEPASLRNLPSVDVVLNAISFDRNSGRTHEEVTCGGLRNLLDATHDRCSKLIQISSTSVYGQSAGEWVNEDSPCEPMQLGGMLNLEAERQIFAKFNSPNGTIPIVLRLAGIYGPERLLSRIASLKESVPLPGRGDAWLNLIHVDDAVNAILACSQKSEFGEIFNVVDDQPVERRTYFELLAQLVGVNKPVFDPSQTRERGSGGINKRCSNVRIRERLAWIPKYPSIFTGLPDSIRKSPESLGRI